jgi:hypothetical protein
MAQSIQELKKRVEDTDLWPESTNEDQCERYARKLGMG